MERIQLLTATGHHVAYVEIVHFPPKHKPDVVLWGTRVFVRGPSDAYVEAFAVASLTPSPGLDVNPSKLHDDKIADISRQNARDWAAVATTSALQAWTPCGCAGCVYCEELSRIRDERLAVPPVDRAAQTTTDGRAVDDVRVEQEAEGNKLHKSYIVLTDAERAKGFVRPVRRTYRHVGTPPPKHELRDLTEDETAKFSQFGYIKFEPYGPEESPKTGRYWTQAQLDNIGKGCRGRTTMSQAIAETYARDPRFYGSTMCVTCGAHYKVGPDGEFVWEGTDERVGT